jgi:ferric-dicitrate binding protein FerR (iron transport regulator)
METTYTWLIWNMKRDPLTGGIGTVHYRVNATNGNVQVVETGQVVLVANPEAEDFIAYESLTPEIVIAWVKSKLDEGDMPTAKVIEKLDAAIAKKLAVLNADRAPLYSNFTFCQ